MSSVLESTENNRDIRDIHSDERVVLSNEQLRRWITDDTVFDLRILERRECQLSDRHRG